MFTRRQKLFASTFTFFIWFVYQDTVLFCLHIWKQTIVYKEVDCCLPIHLFVIVFYSICWSDHCTVFILCMGKKIENLLVLLTADCCWPFKSEAIDLGIQLMIVVKYFPTFAFFALCPFSLPNAAFLKLSWAEVTLFFFFSASDRLIFSPLKKVLKVDLISVYCKR